MSKHKKQHYIPKSYLEPWCDPRIPKGQNPYVWQFSKDGKSVKNRAPKNIFYENDLYTIKIDGQRNLILEKGLQSLEDKYCKIRDHILSKRKSLSTLDKIVVLAFMAAMRNRTISYRDHQKAQWGELIELGHKIKEAYDKATPEQKKAMTSISHSSNEEQSISFDEVKNIAENPLQNLLFAQIAVTTPLLINMDFCVFETLSEHGFITSDNPCVWEDPEAYKRHPYYRAPALMYSSIEITMPISPKQLIFLNRKSIHGYRTIDDHVVNELNRRTRFNCNEYFIFNDKTQNSYWFWKGKEPDDSWGKNHNNKA